MYTCMCTWVQVLAEAGGIWSLKAEVTAVVCFPAWVLETKSGSFPRLVRALKTWAISPSSWLHFQKAASTWWIFHLAKHPVTKPTSVEGVAQWKSTGLTCTRPWVKSPASPNGTKRDLLEMHASSLSTPHISELQTQTEWITSEWRDLCSYLKNFTLDFWMRQTHVFLLHRLNSMKTVLAFRHTNMSGKKAIWNYRHLQLLTHLKFRCVLSALNLRLVLEGNLKQHVYYRHK